MKIFVVTDRTHMPDIAFKELEDAKDYAKRMYIPTGKEPIYVDHMYYGLVVKFCNDLGIFDPRAYIHELTLC